MKNIFFKKKAEQAGIQNAADKEAPESTAVKNEEGKPLETPLPMPKRHVRKAMDYGFEPDPDKMFYELPVSDEDDFDI